MSTSWICSFGICAARESVVEVMDAHAAGLVEINDYAWRCANARCAHHAWVGTHDMATPGDVEDGLGWMKLASVGCRGVGDACAPAVRVSPFRDSAGDQALPHCATCGLRRPPGGSQ